MQCSVVKKEKGFKVESDKEYVILQNINNAPKIPHILNCPLSCQLS